MGKLVLVTGVNGFIGHTFTSAILRLGFNVIGIDIHYNSSFKLEQQSSFTYMQTDITDEKSVESLKTYKPDMIVHLGGLLTKNENTIENFRLFNVNVKSTLTLLELARDTNSHFIFSSSGLVYGNQKGPFREDMKCEAQDFYALTKLLAEQQILYFGQKYGIKYTIFRLSVLYGPPQMNSMFIPSLIDSLINGREFNMTRGEQLRDFLYIEDCIDAFVAGVLMEFPGVYNISTGKPIKISEVAKIAEDIIGKKGLLNIGALEYRANESFEYCLSSEKFQMMSGWIPKVNIKDGLRRTIDWHVKNKSCR